MIRKQDLINVELELNEDQKAIKGDPVKVANAIVMEINFIAGQLFEMTNNLAKLLIYKAKKVYKILSKDY